MREEDGEEDALDDHDDEPLEEHAVIVQADDVGDPTESRGQKSLGVWVIRVV